MKKLYLAALCLLCLALLAGCVAAPAETTAGTVPSTAPFTEPSIAATEPPAAPTTEPVTEQSLQYKDIKALWLSQYDLTDIYLDGGSQRSETDFTARMAQVLDNVAAQGFNTVFLQIRPNADSMYPSEYYPMSSYVVGAYGKHAGYDPVAITVRLAHERALSIHAWINPMRAMTEEELLQVGQEYPIRLWYMDPDLRGKYIVSVKGRWYLNPAYEEVRTLICAGAEEALTRYDFDGLHMDDYFYPTTDPSFDAHAYGIYQSEGGTLTLVDFRREQLSELVYSLHTMTVQSRQGRLFGISPAGNVDTVYNSQYADVYTWCAQPGYIDYICPQVYFGLEHGSFDFVKVCNTWQSMIRTDSVELIVGMTLGKAYTGEDAWAGSGKDEWKQNKDVLARSLQTTRQLPSCRGVAVFCYQYFFDPVTGQSVPQTAEERANFLPILREISWN